VTGNTGCTRSPSQATRRRSARSYAPFPIGASCGRLDGSAKTINQTTQAQTGRLDVDLVAV
jgi:hypothetical protein